MAQSPVFESFEIRNAAMLPGFSKVSFTYEGRCMEPSETHAYIHLSGLFECYSLHSLPMGVELSRQSPIPASEAKRKDAAPPEADSFLIGVDDIEVEEVSIDDRRTKIEVKNFNIDDCLKKTVLVDLDQMDECAHPL